MVPHASNAFLGRCDCLVGDFRFAEPEHGVVSPELRRTADFPRWVANVVEGLVRDADTDAV